MSLLADNLGFILSDDLGNLLADDVADPLPPPASGPRRLKRPRAPALEDLREDDRKAQLALMEARNAIVQREWDDLAIMLLLC